MMTYKGYVGTYELDTDDEVLYGKLVDVNQLVTFEATIAHDLKQAFYDSVDDYLAFCTEQGVTSNQLSSATWLGGILENEHEVSTKKT